MQLTADCLLLVPPIARAATGPQEDELDSSRSARKLWALGFIFAQLAVTNALFVAAVLSTLPALVPHQRLIDALAPAGSVVGGWRVAATLAVGGGAAAVELAGGGVTTNTGKRRRGLWWRSAAERRRGDLGVNVSHVALL